MNMSQPASLSQKSFFSHFMGKVNEDRAIIGLITLCALFAIGLGLGVPCGVLTYCFTGTWWGVMACIPIIFALPIARIVHVAYKAKKEWNISPTIPPPIPIKLFLNSTNPLIEQFFSTDITRIIFSYLSIPTLVNARGVCKFWWNLVQENQKYKDLISHRFEEMRNACKVVPKPIRKLFLTSHLYPQIQDHELIDRLFTSSDDKFPNKDSLKELIPLFARYKKAILSGFSWKAGWVFFIRTIFTIPNKKSYNYILSFSSMNPSALFTSEEPYSALFHLMEFDVKFHCMDSDPPPVTPSFSLQHGRDKSGVTQNQFELLEGLIRHHKPYKLSDLPEHEQPKSQDLDSFFSIWYLGQKTAIDQIQIYEN